MTQAAIGSCCKAGIPGPFVVVVVVESVIDVVPILDDDKERDDDKDDDKDDDNDNDNDNDKDNDNDND